MVDPGGYARLEWGEKGPLTKKSAVVAFEILSSPPNISEVECYKTEKKHKLIGYYGRCFDPNYWKNNYDC